MSTPKRRSLLANKGWLIAASLFVFGLNCGLLYLLVATDRGQAAARGTAWVVVPLFLAATGWVLANSILRPQDHPFFDYFDTES